MSVAIQEPLPVYQAAGDSSLQIEDSSQPAWNPAPPYVAFDCEAQMEVGSKTLSDALEVKSPERLSGVTATVCNFITFPIKRVATTIESITRPLIDQTKQYLDEHPEEAICLVLDCAVGILRAFPAPIYYAAGPIAALSSLLDRHRFQRWHDQGLESEAAAKGTIMAENGFEPPQVPIEDNKRPWCSEQEEVDRVKRKPQECDLGRLSRSLLRRQLLITALKKRRLRIFGHRICEKD